ncbi:S8 family serine peptidase [Leptothermofonsia sichuanensis E412]|uniref:S8 family serine peptidase n=1 Tax=Leptothermofonsia sichuanensis TaxID=2917832 RepID=UPI001CA62678|nr:S8 family serine peptidase [Leptothermofonsia sichuanensis]QZZ23270.1 S8 family serine peptidase [Leptothermofonsia sichuanensis E412]
MTDQTSGNSAEGNSQGTTMPESSMGRVLQRGGEELLLEKVPDRFVVSASDPAALSELTQGLPVEVNPAQVPNQLTEIIVDPTRQNGVMQQMRGAEAVNYATHVYHLKDDPSAVVYVKNQITVQFAPDVEQAAIAQILSELGLRQVKPVVGIPNTFVLELTPEATENPVKIANRLMQRSQVLTAEPDVVVRTQHLYRPSDPLYPKQWHLNHSGGSQLAAGSHVSAEQAWDITRGIRSVVVAIMDDSVDLRHPDFQGVGKLVAPRDFKDKDFLPMPVDASDNHGTSCAGVAVAEENGVGTVGIAPGCALMPIRTTGFLDDGAIEDLFGWAMTRGASVISCSWGPAAVYFPLSLRQRAALTRAATEGRNGKGCVIVFAAGNSNRPTNGTVNERGWPNNVLSGQTAWLGGFTVHPDVITVSASTSLGKKAAYSNWGAEVSVCAPSNNAPPGFWLQQTGYIYTPPEVRGPLSGLGIFTADRVGAEGYDPSSYTADFGGTSSACPLVAGVAALVLSVNPDLTAAEVRQILQQTADKIVDTSPDPQFGFNKGTYEIGGRCDWFGYGKVNAFKAVQAAAQRQKQSIIAASRYIQQQDTTGRAIPDDNPNGVTSQLRFSETNRVRDIQVGVAIDHSFLGDLEIQLIAPSGATVLLQGRTLGRRTSLQTIYTLQTTPSLRRFLGQPARGEWALRVVDFAPGDTGTLKSWQLILGI